MPIIIIYKSFTPLHLAPLQSLMLLLNIAADEELLIKSGMLFLRRLEKKGKSCWLFSLDFANFQKMLSAETLPFEQKDRPVVAW